MFLNCWFHFSRWSWGVRPEKERWEPPLCTSCKHSSIMFFSNSLEKVTLSWFLYLLSHIFAVLEQKQLIKGEADHRGRHTLACFGGQTVCALWECCSEKHTLILVVSETVISNIPVGTSPCFYSPCVSVCPTAASVHPDQSNSTQSYGADSMQKYKPGFKQARPWRLDHASSFSVRRVVQ